MFLDKQSFLNSKSLFICTEHAPNNIQTTIEVAEKVVALTKLRHKTGHAMIIWPHNVFIFSQELPATHFLL